VLAADLKIGVSRRVYPGGLPARYAAGGRES
jgi:hypothetical protein